MNWTKEVEEKAANAGSFIELGLIALNYLETLYASNGGKKFGIVSGPITSGGVGNIEGNREIFRKTIENLENLGILIFDQMPFQPHMDRIRKTLGDSYDQSGLLDSFYLPLFKSGYLGRMYMIHDFQSSFGSRWEHTIALDFSVERVLLPEDFHLMEIVKDKAA